MWKILWNKTVTELLILSIRFTVYIYSFQVHEITHTKGSISLFWIIWTVFFFQIDFHGTLSTLTWQMKDSLKNCRFSEHVLRHAPGLHVTHIHKFFCVWFIHYFPLSSFALGHTCRSPLLWSILIQLRLHRSVRGLERGEEFISGYSQKNFSGDSKSCWTMKCSRKYTEHLC